MWKQVSSPGRDCWLTKMFPYWLLVRGLKREHTRKTWCLPPAELQCVRSSRELHRNCGGFQNEAVASACTAENTPKPTELELLKITLSLALHMCISVCLCVGYVHVKSEDGTGYPEAGVVGSREMPPHWCWEPLVMAEPFLHPQEFATLKWQASLCRTFKKENWP